MVRLMYKDHTGCLRWPGRYGRRRRANVLHRGLDVYVHLEESGGWIRLVMIAVHPRRFPHVGRLRDAYEMSESADASYFEARRDGWSLR